MAAGKRPQLKPGPVRATARGYYGSKLREPGEVFHFAGGEQGSWFIPAPEARAAAEGAGLKPGSKAWIREKIMAQLDASGAEEWPEIPDTVAELKELAADLGVDLTAG